MPISRKEFESGEVDPSLLVEEVVCSSPDYAYTVEELIIELASHRIGLTREEVQNILSSLEAQRKIKSNTVRGVIYYICEKTMGFRPS